MSAGAKRRNDTFLERVSPARAGRTSRETAQMNTLSTHSFELWFGLTRSRKAINLPLPPPARLPLSSIKSTDQATDSTLRRTGDPAALPRETADWTAPRFVRGQSAPALQRRRASENRCIAVLLPEDAVLDQRARDRHGARSRVAGVRPSSTALKISPISSHEDHL